VEEVQSLSPRPTVLFFYCKDGDVQRDNFVSIARGLLAQLLQQNKDLLPYFYEKAANSPEPVLSNPPIVKELLDMGIRNCKSVYIILDGLDECSRDERKHITHWFRKLIEELPPANAEAIRCLFVSQDDSAARKDFAGISAITVRSQDNEADIREYSSVWADKIKKKFKINEQMRNDIVTNILKTADSMASHPLTRFPGIANDNTHLGMFILAKLICDNLYHQTTVEGLEEELKPDKFPKEIKTA
jgi:hypothetical protein